MATNAGTKEELIAEIVALTSALAEAVSLLREVDADANNMQIDIAHFMRRHHRVVSPITEIIEAS